MTDIKQAQITYLLKQRTRLHDDLVELDDVIANAPMLQTKVIARAQRHHSEVEIRLIEEQLRALGWQR